MSTHGQHKRTRIRLWDSGRFQLAVYRVCSGWMADVTEWSVYHRSRPYAVASEIVRCRSRSRAVDVGRKMLARTLARDRIVRLA